LTTVIDEEVGVEIDPVCGMEVDAASAAGSYEYQGTTYYFCSQGCLEDFAEDPASYVA
jgi:P-type Cu+ transporter